MSATSLCMPARGVSKVIAVFSYRYDANLVPSLIENISPFVHGYVGYDDRQSEAVLSDEPARRNALHAKAREMEADWILAVDPDERFEHGLADRIGSMTPKGDAWVIWKFNLREMFSPDRYRTDGLWGSKSQIRLYPASATLVPLEKSLHGLWISSRDGYRVAESNLNLYHLRHASSRRSRHRRDTYAAADPERRFAKRGYDYLSDMRGARMQKIASARMFSPPHFEDHELWAAPTITDIGSPVSDPVAVKLRLMQVSWAAQASDAAAYVCEDLLSPYPQDTDLRSVAASLAQTAGRPDDALRLLRETEQPASLLDDVTTARALLDRGERTEAAAILDKAIKRGGGSHFLQSLQRGLIVEDDISVAQDAPWRRWLKGPATLHEGPQNGKGPLTAIVIGYQAQPQLAQAVSSIRSQSEDVEIVVVNSGSGNVRGVLSSHLNHIRLIDIEERLFVGAARNVGVNASHGRYVAFLAGDCIALPGWVAGRIKRHDAGALMVSTAVVPTHPNTLIGALVDRVVFPRRSPDLNEDEALHYGRSFHRSVFTEAGYFAPGLRIGEDSEFNRRAARLAVPTWAPEVIVRHDDKRSLMSQLIDIFGRARRAASFVRPRNAKKTAPDWISRALDARATQLRAPGPGSGADLGPVRRWILQRYLWVALKAYGMGLRKAEQGLAQADVAEQAARAVVSESPQEAVLLIGKALEIESQRWYLYLFAGNTLVRCKPRTEAQFEEALMHWQQALALKPTATRPLACIAKLLANSGQVSRALEFGEQTLITAPNQVKNHQLVAALALDAGLADLALFHAQLALVANPADIDTHLFLAKLHRLGDRKKTAKQRRVMSRLLRAYDEICFVGN